MEQLTRLDAVQYTDREKEMQVRAIRYLDREIRKEYDRQRKSTVSSLRNALPSPLQLHYLYVRSAYREIPETSEVREAIRYYTEQAGKQWRKYALYEKAEIALLMHRNGNKKVAGEILHWLRKTATTSPEKGMYWANNRREENYFLSPIDVHCLLMTVFRTLGTNTAETDRLKQWLLNQKQTQSWESTPSTVNAIYTLLSSGSDWLTETNETTIQWGDKTLHATSGETAAGYLKESVNGKDLTPTLHTVNLRKKGTSPAWGAVYYQYAESIGKITATGRKGALSVEKKIIPPDASRPLKVGDKVIVRLTLRTDRDLEYVSLKDLRPGCMEPAVQRSGIVSVDWLRAYHSPKDASENFFFDHLPRGTYVLEYAAYVSRSGCYSGGIATLQCLYAPEFTSHTEGDVIFVYE
jgi:uncharacterized protein YfaS (alpha-2-macroglobulin family)